MLGTCPWVISMTAKDWPIAPMGTGQKQQLDCRQPSLGCCLRGGSTSLGSRNALIHRRHLKEIGGRNSKCFWTIACMPEAPVQCPSHGNRIMPISAIHLGTTGVITTNLCLEDLEIWHFYPKGNSQGQCLGLRRRIDFCAAYVPWVAGLQFFLNQYAYCKFTVYISMVCIGLLQRSEPSWPPTLQTGRMVKSASGAQQSAASS